MRAPDQKFSGYPEDWWPKVRAIFRRVGVDADKVVIDRWFANPEWEYVPGQQSLRDELKQYAMIAAALDRSAGPPAPKVRAKELAAVLEAAQVFREYTLAESAERGVIDRIEGYIKRDLAELKARSPTADNASKPVRAAFCEGLLAVWRRTVTSAGQRGEQERLVDFLFVCTEPLFPTKRDALKKWLARRERE